MKFHFVWCLQSTEERVVDYTSGFRQEEAAASPVATLAAAMPLADNDQMSEGGNRLHCRVVLTALCQKVAIACTLKLH